MTEREDDRALQDRAIAAVEIARAAGADDVWASAYSDRSIECQQLDDALEYVKHSHSRSLVVEIYVDGRYSAHSTSDLRDDFLRGFLRDAVALTRAMQADPYRALPDPALYEGQSTIDLDPVDRGLAGLDNDARGAWCEAMAAPARGKPGVLSVSSTLIDGTHRSADASSNGFLGAKERSYVHQVASVTLEDGERRPEGSLWVSANHRADLPDAPFMGQQALARAQAQLGITKGPTTTTAMVVDRLAVGRLLQTLLGPANGQSIQQGRSFWAGDAQEASLPEILAVTDEPLLPRAVGSRHYDAEGIAARPLTIVEGGSLRNAFIDTYYARKLKVAPTTGGFSNVVVRPGAGDVTSLAADVGEGIYVTRWLGGNSDSTTGEFSIGLRGHRIHKGRVDAPVGEMNVSGNVLELFSRLRAVGADSWGYGPLRCPTVVFDGVSFSGA